jgi:hypothetical protein
MINLAPDISLGSILGQALGQGIGQGVSGARDSAILNQVLQDFKANQNAPFEQRLVSAQQSMMGLSPELQNMLIRGMQESEAIDSRARRESENILLRDRLVLDRQEKERERERQKADALAEVLSDPEFEGMNQNQIYKKMLEIGRDRGVTPKDAWEASERVYSQSREEHRYAVADVDKRIDIATTMLRNIETGLMATPEDKALQASLTRELSELKKERSRLVDAFNYRGREYPANLLVDTGMMHEPIVDELLREFGVQDFDEMDIKSFEAFEKRLRKKGLKLPGAVRESILEAIKNKGRDQPMKDKPKDEVPEVIDYARESTNRNMRGNQRGGEGFGYGGLFD